MATKTKTIGFRPTEDDEKIIRERAVPGESTSDTIRRALRLLDRAAWEEQARADAVRLKDEDLSDEPDDWRYDEAGNIVIVASGGSAENVE
jgi:Arc/MetJ-type ribon-helix-helix transcriptional regulator